MVKRFTLSDVASTHPMHPAATLARREDSPTVRVISDIEDLTDLPPGEYKVIKEAWDYLEALLPTYMKDLYQGEPPTSQEENSME